MMEICLRMKNQHDMNQPDTIRRTIKLRKYLFMDVWPNHNIETEKAPEDQKDSTAPATSLIDTLEDSQQESRLCYE